MVLIYLCIERWLDQLFNDIIKSLGVNNKETFVQKNNEYHVESYSQESILVYLRESAIKIDPEMDYTKIITNTKNIHSDRIKDLESIINKLDIRKRVSTINHELNRKGKSYKDLTIKTYSNIDKLNDVLVYIQGDLQKIIDAFANDPPLKEKYLKKYTNISTIKGLDPSKLEGFFNSIKKIIDSYKSIYAKLEVLSDPDYIKKASEQNPNSQHRSIGSYISAFLEWDKDTYNSLKFCLNAIDHAMTQIQKEIK
jgi:hypothetical protein